MFRIKLKCKTITPMFMAGADGKTPELRPSEFKGMMRFWWRAIKAEDNIEKLREEEAEIFGGTGEKEGKSKIILKVYSQPSNQFLGDNLEKNYNLDLQFDRKANCLIGKHSGIGYLLYSTVLHNQERRYIKPDFSFNIELSSYDEKCFKNALASLWAAIYLGGFGTRARRGGGNIVVEKVEGDVERIKFIPEGDNSEEIFKWIKINLEECFKLINNGPPKNFCTKYSNFSFSRVIISNKTFQDWKVVLDDIGKIYAKFRTYHKGNIFDVAVFGLPVMHKNKTKIESKNSKKRGSPIIIKIFLSNKNFYWAVLRLTGEFLPENDFLISKRRGEIDKTQKPDYKLIDEFWNRLRKICNNREYNLSQPEILGNIIDKIKSECNPDKITLFGSRARGDAHKNADIDIAVENPKKSVGSLNINAPIDIVDITKIDPNFKDKIEYEGVVLYERKS